MPYPTQNLRTEYIRLCELNGRLIDLYHFSIELAERIKILVVQRPEYVSIVAGSKEIAENLAEFVCVDDLMRLIVHVNALVDLFDQREWSDLLEVIKLVCEPSDRNIDVLPRLGEQDHVAAFVPVHFVPLDHACGKRLEFAVIVHDAGFIDEQQRVFRQRLSGKFVNINMRSCVAVLGIRRDVIIAGFICQDRELSQQRGFATAWRAEIHSNHKTAPPLLIKHFEYDAEHIGYHDTKKYTGKEVFKHCGVIPLIRAHIIGALEMLPPTVSGAEIVTDRFQDRLHKLTPLYIR